MVFNFTSFFVYQSTKPSTTVNQKPPTHLSKKQKPKLKITKKKRNPKKTPKKLHSTIR